MRRSIKYADWGGNTYCNHSSGQKTCPKTVVIMISNNILLTLMLSNQVPYLAMYMCMYVPTAPKPLVK